jgi:hypothetical protein
MSRGVAEPFGSDPEFWRSLCASADALALLAVAVACAAVLRLSGAVPVLVLLPFALPGILLFRAAVSSSRFHQRHLPLPAVIDTARGEQSWRDAERTAVAAAFVPALLRRRHLALPTPDHPTA